VGYSVFLDGRTSHGLFGDLGLHKNESR